MQTRTHYQVVIAGAGPAGLLLAKKLCEQGISVAVYEPKPEYALGHDWSDAVEKSALASAGFKIPEVVDGRYVGKWVKTAEEDSNNLFEPHCINPLEIRSPDLSCTVPGGVAFRYITTDRKVLSRVLAEQATAAGAHVYYRHRVDKLLGNTTAILENIRVAGAHVTDLENERSFEMHADVTVDATGLGAMLRVRLSGAPEINRKFENSELAYACRTVRRLDPEKGDGDDLTDHYRYGAHKGYFWTHIHHKDSIDIGGGVSEMPDRIDPMLVIGEMIKARPSIMGEEIRGGGGAVLVGKSPLSLVASGFLCVGDSAGQVIPTTGCGTGSAMTSALLSAGVILAALQKGDCSIRALWPCNYVWFSGRGSHFAALSAIKDVLQKLSHEQVSFLMEKGIMNSKMLTPALNGVFEAPELRDMALSAASGFSRPGLLLKLSRANHIGKKIFRHYRNYPTHWEPAAFSGWTKKTRKLFEKL